MGVMVHAVSVPLSVHMNSSMIECVGESLATSLEHQMHSESTPSMREILTLSLSMEWS